MNINLRSMEKNYSDSSFWLKLKRFSKKAGTKVVYTALLLYYVLRSPNVPIKAKAIIIGALGYFISPIDIIPDFLLGVGYTDDLSVLVGALVSVAVYVDNDVKHKARTKIIKWFGTDSPYDLIAIDEKLNRE
ncbi:YkvA family protein [Paenibacillus sp. GP183]|uniref:YkvA family protein n=1 Tax=Paenibacillus sp. GP183 TaxID=1882751 RepID=UPI0008963491|nr:YkvA family protein [Paenibacillus sp. GP183]SEB94292.1 Protein of unknown function [Paenibacillus sp. GP183]